MTEKQYIIETPATHPHHVFETRTFNCRDSKLAYNVTFPKMMWKLFERYTKEDQKYHQILSFCSDLFIQFGQKENQSFSDILHYWILCEHRRKTNQFYSAHFNSHAELR